MKRRTIIVAISAVLLASVGPAAAHTDKEVSLSSSKTDACQTGDSCTNTVAASWDANAGAGSIGGTLKVEARGIQRSTQGFTARYAMAVSVPAKTRTITLSSGWRVVGEATAANNGVAGCSVIHPNVNYVTQTPLFYADGEGSIPVVGYGALAPADFTVTTTLLRSSSPFPRNMTLWAELDCVAWGQNHQGLASSAELNLIPDTSQLPGTAFIHLHATFSS